MYETISTNNAVSKHMSIRERLVLGGLFFFSSHGYSKTSIPKLTKHCSVNRSLFYDYFSNKDDLASACIQYQQTYYEQHLFALLPPDPTHLTVQKILRVFKRFILKLSCTASNPLPLLPHHLVIVFMLECPKQMKTKVHHFLQSWQEFFYRLLRCYHDPEDARELARLQVVRWSGACVHTSLFRTNHYLLDCWSELSQLLQDRQKDS